MTAYDDIAVHRPLRYFHQRPYGFDFSFVADWPLFRPQVRRLTREQIVEARVQVGEIDLYACRAAPAQLEGTVVLDRAVTVHGLCGWFVAHLGDGITIDTGPGHETHWQQLLFPLREPVHVGSGSEVRVRIHTMADRSGEGTLWRWSVSDEKQSQDLNDFVHRAWLQRHQPIGRLQ